VVGGESDGGGLTAAATDARELQDVLRALPRIGARRVTTLLRLESVKPSAPVPVRRQTP